jgi:hypothetical protein
MDNVKERPEAKVWEGTVLTVPNRHYECCGKPPALQAKACYTAYFENDYGEQIVFQYNYKEKKGILWHGDYSWEEPVTVMGGGTTMIMSHEERTWLRLVWDVATRHESKSFQIHSALDFVNAYKAIYDELLTRPDLAGDDSMRRSFLKAKGKLEKQGKALTDQLIKAQIEEAAEGGKKQG